MADYWTTCAAGPACRKPARDGRPGRVKMAPNREVDGSYYHKDCVPAGKSVVDERDPRVPGYGDQAKYTKRTWKQSAGGK